MKAIVPPETPGTVGHTHGAPALSASTMYREKFMVCLRILVLNAKIRISRIQKANLFAILFRQISSAQPKMGIKTNARVPKLSFHQFFRGLPFFAPACVRRCRTSRSPAGSGHPVRIGVRRGGISAVGTARFRNAARCAGRTFVPKQPLPDLLPLPDSSGDILCG